MLIESKKGEGSKKSFFSKTKKIEEGITLYVRWNNLQYLLSMYTVYDIFAIKYSLINHLYILKSIYFLSIFWLFISTFISFADLICVVCKLYGADFSKYWSNSETSSRNLCISGYD